MAVLVLLNGPPASGKSTIAQRVVDSRPLSLNLDIDVVRGMLGGWLDDPSTAGLTARSLALVMAEAHLAAGSDVIVPQFLGRTDFIERLADAADRSGARFVETALWIDRAGAIAVFADRRAAPSTQAHHDAAALVDRSEQADPVGQTRSPESSTSDLLLDESKSSPATSTRPSHALRRHSISAPRNPHCAGASTAHSGPTATRDSPGTYETVSSITEVRRRSSGGCRTTIDVGDRTAPGRPSCSTSR